LVVPLFHRNEVAESKVLFTYLYLRLEKACLASSLGPYSSNYEQSDRVVIQAISKQVVKDKPGVNDEGDILGQSDGPLLFPLEQP